jgi:hypothetical protein
MMWNKLLAGAVTAAVLGAGGIAVAGAVGGHGAPSGDTAKASATASGNLDTAGRGAARLRHAAKIAADTIGISVAQLRTAVAGGQTIAAVATAHHVDPQHVVDALVHAADTRIDAALKNGRIDATRAATLKQRAATAADAFVNHTQDVVAKLKSRAAHRVAGRHALLDAAASAIHISTTELRTDLRSGQSIADVATAHHVAVQTVVDTLVNAAKAKIDAAVQAGKLTPQRAARLEQRLPTLVDKLVNRHFDGTHANGATTPADALSA